MTGTFVQEWVPLGAGQARSISVGPNGVPWITGAPGGNSDAAGPAWVYYLTWEQGSSLIPTPKWVYDNFSAINIYVNLNGMVFASDSTGAIYMDVGILAYPEAIEADELPSGNWWKVANADPARANTFAVTVCGNSAIVNAGEMFYPWQYLPTEPNVPDGTINGEVSIWCTGCDGRDPSTGPFTFWTDRDASLWVMQMSRILPSAQTELHITPWAPVAGVAEHISMVTTSGGTTGNASDVQQTPWVVNAEQEVWYYSAVHGNNADYPPTDGNWVKINCWAPALYVTDGFILTTEGVWFTGGHTDPSQWNPYIGFPSDDNGNPVALKQIAAGGWISTAVIGGPPRGLIVDGDALGAPPQEQLPGPETALWGLDYEGNVYYVEGHVVTPIQ